MGKQKKTKNSPAMKLRDFHAQLVRNKLVPESSRKCEKLENKFAALAEDVSDGDSEVGGDFGTPEAHCILAKHVSLSDLVVEEPGACSEPSFHQSFEDSFPHLVHDASVLGGKGRCGEGLDLSSSSCVDVAEVKRVADRSGMEHDASALGRFVDLDVADLDVARRFVVELQKDTSCPVVSSLVPILGIGLKFLEGGFAGVEEMCARGLSSSSPLKNLEGCREGGPSSVQSVVKGNGMKIEEGNVIKIGKKNYTLSKDGAVLTEGKVLSDVNRIGDDGAFQNVEAALEGKLKSSSLEKVLSGDVLSPQKVACNSQLLGLSGELVSANVDAAVGLCDVALAGGVAELASCPLTDVQGQQKGLGLVQVEPAAVPLATQTVGNFQAAAQAVPVEASHAFIHSKEFGKASDKVGNISQRKGLDGFSVEDLAVEGADVVQASHENTAQVHVLGSTDLAVNGADLVHAFHEKTAQVQAMGATDFCSLEVNKGHISSVQSVKGVGDVGGPLPVGSDHSEVASQCAYIPVDKGKSHANSVGNWSLLFKSNGASPSHEHMLPKSSSNDRKTPSFNVDLNNNIVEIPLNISSMGRAQWHNALMGFFVDKFTSFHYVRNWAFNIWKDRIEDVLTFDNGFFVFQFKKEVDVISILEEGPFYCGNRLVILKKWYPGIRMCKEEFSCVPVWMKFFNVPLELWTNEGLGYIASAFGKPLFLDEHTFQKSRLNFARVCVEIKADCVIPPSFMVNLGYGDPYEIRVEVPWKPQSCCNCKIFGHPSSRCPLNPSTPVKELKVVRNLPKDRQEWVEVAKRKVKGKEVIATPMVKPHQGIVSDSCSVGDRVPTVGDASSSVTGNGSKIMSSGSESKTLLDKIQDLQRVREKAVANLSTKPKKSCLKSSSRPSSSGVG